jgi:hypothetical protein
MAKKKSKKKELSNKKYPTLFALEGGIRHYKSGSLLELYSQIELGEWQSIVEETIKYKVFLECLKDTAIKLLSEQWTEDDEWFRIHLEVAVSRMRNIDPLYVSKYDQEALKSAYTAKMVAGAKELKLLIDDMRRQERDVKANVSGI